MEVTIEMAASINGLIATKEGSEDFLSERNYQIMLDFLKEYDCLVWGNKTFQNVISWGEDYINDLKDIIQNRKIVLARELTKIHEEFIRGGIDEILKNVKDIKGEFVLIIEGAKREEKENELNCLSLEDHYKYYEKQGLDKKEIIKQIAKDRKVNKNEIYKKFV